MKIDNCPTCGKSHDNVLTYKIGNLTMAKCPNGEGLSCFCVDKYLMERRFVNAQSNCIDRSAS